MDSHSHSPSDSPGAKAAFHKPSNDPSNRKYRRRSPVSGSSSSDGERVRERSSTPTHRKDDRRDIDGDHHRSRYSRDGGSNRNADRRSYNDRRHDDYKRRGKYADEDDKSFHKLSPRTRGGGGTHGSHSDQHKDTFFTRVTKHYNELCSYQRSKSQIFSKWKDMNAKMMKFNRIYNNERAQHKSGWSEDDYMRRAHARFRNENNNKTFTHETAWKIVKDHPQWLEQPNMEEDEAYNPRPSKRSKSMSEQNTTSSDSRCRFDLNEASNENEYEVHVQEPQRPIGRDKAKRAASTTFTKDSENTMASLKGYVEKILIDNDKLISVESDIARSKREKLDIMRQREERKREEKKMKDLEFFISSHEHLEGAQLNAVLKQKEHLRQKYDW